MLREVFGLQDTEGLGNEGGDDVVEGFLTEAVPEGMEGIVAWGSSIGEATQEGEPSIEAQLSGEVSFRGGEAEVDEQQGLEEALMVIPLRACGGVFVLEQGRDKREVHALEEDIEGVIGWYDGGYLLRSMKESCLFLLMLRPPSVGIDKDIVLNFAAKGNLCIH